jgi:carnitine 3-dehydrogenase
MALSKEVRRIAIVGTGAIGASWAAFYLARGFDVIATDPDSGAEASVRHYIDTAWQGLKVLGISPKGSPEHLCFKSNIAEAVAEADFIQESGPDHKEVKIGLFAEMDQAAPPDSIIASSSAGLTMSVMQSACRHPERCVIGHPLNPPHIMPLVEVAGGAKTSAEAIQQAIAFYASIGKKPILLRKEVVGHAANRLEAALYREIASLISQGVLDVADADAAVCWGPGLRWGVMGPNLLFHLGQARGGIHHFMKHLAGPMSKSWSDLGNPELTPDLAQCIVDGVVRGVGDRPLEKLAQERDEVLLGLLRLRAKFSNSSKPAGRSARGGRKG